jgi:hypothetical protein
MSFSHALNFYAVAFDTWRERADTILCAPEERADDREDYFLCAMLSLVDIFREYRESYMDNPLSR